ncbi:hypothetical protein [uncultured Dokdonia sp.]|uniref:hypothetical protein n=1 Tax=uncultured Dokdonia sp. TaxID=575653 RepID=UPI002617D7D9|nr:hypothetical protein [uncultured Dokdonia sp.]
MGLLFVLIGYILDFKKDKSNFIKEMAVGLAYFIGNLILALILHFVFGFHFILCIFVFAIEIVLLFSIKAYIQTKQAP